MSYPVLSGKAVAMDGRLSAALGMQSYLVTQKDADYVFTVKGNQPTLQETHR